ncbi:MAG: ATP-dependent helicase [Nitrospirota bacterium]
MIDYDTSLNEEQRQVVLAGNGPSMVIAGAGSGKTRVVTYRVARLIETGLYPERILLLTFTNKAAKEMLSRVEGLIGIDIRRLWGGTFHHIGNMIIRRHADLIGYRSNYTILDREDQKDLIEACVADLSIDTRDKKSFPKGEILADIISHTVNTGAETEEIVEKRCPMFGNTTDDIRKVSDQYRKKKKDLNLMDFDDLLLNLKLLIGGFPEIRSVYSGRFEQILIDEYQDTNRLQAEIIDLFASKNRNLMVVGDDSQSIYSFRGANFNNIIEFPKRYPDTRIYKLETNYRSAPEILKLANSSIDHNERKFQKSLRATRPGGQKPLVIPLKDVYQQGGFVADRISEHHNEGVSFNEIAVLYRSHYHSMELQLELTKRGIPFKVRSGLRFFEQAHIKDVASYLKIVANPTDELAWKRVFRLIQGIGKATADKIWKDLSVSADPIKTLADGRIAQMIPKKGISGWERFCKVLDLISNDEIRRSPGNMIRIILQEGYTEYMQGTYLDQQERSADLNQFAEFASRYQSLDDLLGELALLGGVESEASLLKGNEDESVILSSIHQAKGLEWKVVFIIWLSDGRFPTARSLENPDNEEEERRLFYVGATRAKDELCLCYPIISGSWSRTSLLRPSRFLEELERDTYSKFIMSDEICDLIERADLSDVRYR